MAKSVPQRLLARMDEAGASAYAWYDQELTTYLDPTGAWSRASALIQRGGVVLWIVLVSVAAAQHVWWTSILVCGLLVVGALRVAGESVSWPFTAAATVLFDPVHLVGAHGAGLLGALMVVVVATSPRVRDAALEAFLVVLGLLRLGNPDGSMLWISIGAALGSGLTLGWLLSGRTLATLPGRITHRIAHASPPPPPSRVPWLVRHVKGTGDLMANVPPTITQKKAGGFGERRTGLVLLGLHQHRGVRIVHDVDAPGTRIANTDHVVLAPTGLFVLDTKQFGTRHDPGEVFLDTGSGEIVHRNSLKTRSLTRSVDMAAWATRNIGKVVGVRARGLLVIHNAAVAQGLTVVCDDGTEVDVISAQNLIARIETGPGVLSRWQLSNLGWALTKLRSATTGGAPRITRPVGAKRNANIRGVWEPSPRPHCTSPQAHAAPADVSSAPGPPEPPSTSATPPTAGTDERAQERWSQMEVSEPAAADDISPELRGLGRGTPVSVIEFVTPGIVGGDAATSIREPEVRSREMVAVSPPCHGRNGAYVWVCDPAQWRIHQDTNKPVYVATVHVDKIMPREVREQA